MEKNNAVVSEKNEFFPENKYIYFKKVEEKPKTSVWHVISKSNDYILGKIEWYREWRQYVFLPFHDTSQLLLLSAISKLL